MTGGTSPVTLSVIVPTLDEAERLPQLLRDLKRLPGSFEVIVADGGSLDSTRSLALAHGARLVRTAPGRGPQLRAGASAARGHWLLFVHADTRLNAKAAAALTEFLDRDDPSTFAHFRLRFDAVGRVWRLLEFGQRLRERMFGLPYGDQGLLVARTLYDAAGGHPDWPLFEDVGVLRRLTERGRYVRLPAHLTTSARRYRDVGPLRQWLRNVALMGLFQLGVPPRRLVGWYSRGLAPLRLPPPREAVVVFARAPRAGQVKTRLARQLGESEALRIYRTLGRRTVDEARRSGRRVVVFHTPADAVDEVREWLGGDVQYRPQPTGDLGSRMSGAIDHVLESADAVCLVGTDVPGLQAEHIERAFHVLASHDLVLGPAADGGYWLIGTTSSAPELFVEMTWSTSTVCEETVARAKSAGRSLQTIDVLADVDVASDVPETLRAG